MISSEQYRAIVDKADELLTELEEAQGPAHGNGLTVLTMRDESRRVRKLMAEYLAAAMEWDQ